MQRKPYAHLLTDTEMATLMAGGTVAFDLPAGYAPMTVEVDHHAIFGTALETRTRDALDASEVFTLSLTTSSGTLTALPSVEVTTASVAVEFVPTTDMETGALTGFDARHVQLTRTGVEPLPPGVIRMTSDPPTPG